MSRRNNVRGPTSALTEFLKESGITPTTIARRVRTREVQQPVAGPSSAVQRTEQNEEQSPVGPSRDAEEYASDHLDESEDEQPAPKKRKLTKAQEAKSKAKEKEKVKGKAKGKKKGDNDDYEDDDEDDDAYTALSKMWKDTSKPPVGSFKVCARCTTQFTVTKYTMAANPPPGFLCHKCAKASGADPFKKPAAPRKRKTERRAVISFEERRLPSLASLCIQIITEHIDDVEALGDIGSVNMDEIAKAIARDRSLNAQNAPLFYDVANTNLTLYDATNLMPPALSTLASLNPNLTTLRLDYCGRIDNTVISAWSTALPQLKRVELLGPFLVRVEAWKTFFKSHPDLEGFLITQSPRFDIECMQTLVDSCKKIKELRLKEIGKMEDGFLEHLKKLGGQLTYLDLSYPGNPEALSEGAVIDLMGAVCGTLTHLDLSNNLLLTDGFLYQGLKPHARALNSLVLANLPELTDAGVAEFFNTWKSAAENTFTPNPPLSVLDLSRNQELSSNALTALLKHSGRMLSSLNINGWKTTSEEALKSIASYCPHLRKLDIGWCRELDDWVIKEVLDKCDRIEEVKVWGCQRLTDKCPRKRNVNITGIETHFI